MHSHSLIRLTSFRREHADRTVFLFQLCAQMLPWKNRYSLECRPSIPPQMVANTDPVYFVITTYHLVSRRHRLKLPYSCNHSGAVRPDVISVALNSDSIGS
jgi:hypothetical protein